MSLHFLKVNLHDNTIFEQFKNQHPHANKMDYDSLEKAFLNELYWPADALETNLKQFGFSTTTLFFNFVDNALFGESWARKHGKTADTKRAFLSLIEQIAFYNPDVIYFHEVRYYTREFYREIRKRCPNLKMLLGFDCGYSTDEQVAHYLELDAFITCVSHLAERIKNMGLETAHCIYHAFDERILGKINTTEKKRDAIFAGTLCDAPQSHSSRIELLKYLQQQDINIDIHSPSCIDGLKSLPPVYGKAMYQKLAEHAIVVNMHAGVSGGYAGNLRIFEATGVGACLLTENSKNISDFFEPDKEVVAYGSKEEACEKIKWLLHNPDKMREIAMAGQKRTLLNHSYSSRSRQIHTIIKEKLKL